MKKGLEPYLRSFKTPFETKVRIVLCQNALPFEILKRYLILESIPFLSKRSPDPQDMFLTKPVSKKLILWNFIEDEIDQSQLKKLKGWVFLSRKKNLGSLDDKKKMDTFDPLVPFEKASLLSCYEILTKLFRRSFPFSLEEAWFCFEDDFFALLAFLLDENVQPGNSFFFLLGAWKRKRFDMLWIYLKLFQQNGTSVLAVFHFLVNCCLKALQAKELQNWSKIPFPLMSKLKPFVYQHPKALENFLQKSVYLEKEIKKSSLPYETLFLQLTWSFYGA
jgi:hypothetical protein